ncbi:hypothetical protein QFC21_003973 [Naganishia friedmannii]|uniref:Uncharacterized protein n=1 Tax=Naganishia friedmannii TaxID=89922 RepID=A0ACC2VLJ9_9TREE|nr:hypothetical protein QFC21_003973 [Naganishia friedmannii]
MAPDKFKKSKIYALRNGKKPGLYFSWKAMQSQLEGWKGFKTQAKAQAFLEKLGSARPQTAKGPKKEHKVDKPPVERVSKPKPSSPLRVYPEAHEDIPYHQDPAFFPWMLKDPVLVVKPVVTQKSLPIGTVPAVKVPKKTSSTSAPPATQSAVVTQVSVVNVTKKASSKQAPLAKQSVGARLPVIDAPKKTSSKPASSATQSVVTKVSVVNVPKKASSKPAPLTARSGKTRSYHYAVKKGFKRGVYTTWEECKANVQGYLGRGGSGPIFKKFPTEEEATAWLQGAIPRGSQVDPRLPDSLRWDGMDAQQVANSSPQSVESVLTRLAEVRSEGFKTTEDGALVVYTDGSARDNGKKGAEAGSGVWWGEHGKARKWGFNNMIGESVKNQDLIVHLLTLLSQREQANGVRLKHVRAHRGEGGNEGADRLADKGNKRSAVPDRTDWFNMNDFNRYRRQQAIRLAIIKTPGQQQGVDSAPPVVAKTVMSAASQIQELLELVDYHAKRLANAGSATDALNGASGMSEAVAAELRELKELADVDVDFHADLWLSPEEQAALAVND